MKQMRTIPTAVQITGSRISAVQITGSPPDSGPMKENELWKNIRERAKIDPGLADLVDRVLEYYILLGTNGNKHKR